MKVLPLPENKCKISASYNDVEILGHLSMVEQTGQMKNVSISVFWPPFTVVKPL